MKAFEVNGGLVFFETFNHKLIFVNSKSVSELQGPSSFLLQPNLISFAILSFNYWFNDVDTTI